jgi:hypothetical protein
VLRDIVITRADGEGFVEVEDALADARRAAACRLEPAEVVIADRCQLPEGWDRVELRLYIAFLDAAVSDLPSIEVVRRYALLRAHIIRSAKECDR